MKRGVARSRKKARTAMEKHVQKSIENIMK